MGSGYKRYGELLSLGIQFPVCIGIGFGLGALVDDWAGTRPTVTLIGVLFGIAAAFVNLFRLVKRFGGDEQTPSE